ncbi:MAG: AI-2E family transporter [Proteobacteria bacterium]|nr:AI-2E family transporter [Pseudomonadota bacterium]
MSSDTSRNALVVIAVVAGGAALYWLRDILTPLALAAFLLIMIDGLARLISRFAPKAPVWLPLTGAIGVIVLTFMVSLWVMVNGGRSFVGEMSGMHARANVIIADIAGRLHLGVAPSLDEMLTHLDPQKYAGPMLNGMQGIVSSAFFVLIYLGFLIASRSAFGKKIVALFPTRGERGEAKRIFDRIREGVESYVWVQTVLGLLIAVLAWAVMEAVGLNNALFWAFVIFVTGYIPIVGGAIAVVAPPLFLLVEPDSQLWKAGVLFVALEVILFVVGNVLLPRMQAKSMNIDPVVVLLSLAFWGALWGLTGAFLSTPLTVIVMAVLAEFKGSRWIAVLLSGDGKPYPMEDQGSESPPPPKKPRRRRAPAAA